MPIRFRCVYCDKLLGIARRKAGAVVNCPQCGQPLIVPTPDPGAEPEPEPTPLPPPAPAPAAARQPAIPPPPSGRLFEQDDFDVLLEGDATLRTPEPPPTSRRPAPAPPPANPSPFAVDQLVPPGAEAERPRGRKQGRGVVLSTPMLILAVLAVLALMGIAFGGGVLAGRMLFTGGG